MPNTYPLLGEDSGTRQQSTAIAADVTGSCKTNFTRESSSIIALFISSPLLPYPTSAFYPQTRVVGFGQLLTTAWPMICTCTYKPTAKYFGCAQRLVLRV